MWCWPCALILLCLRRRVSVWNVLSLPCVRTPDLRWPRVLNHSTFRESPGPDVRGPRPICYSCCLSEIAGLHLHVVEAGSLWPTAVCGDLLITKEARIVTHCAVSAAVVPLLLLAYGHAICG